jgi:hypothetical protein
MCSLTPKLIFAVALPCLLLFSSCHDQTKNSHSYFDSLVVAQVTNLSALHAKVSKKAQINGVTDQAVFAPSQSGWKSELDLLHTLSDFERPAFQDRYTLKENAPDTKSNLLIRSYRANGNVPVPEIKFYYYRQFKNIRRIEATLREKNILFSTIRLVSLEFEEFKGLPLLISYAIEGGQKMILNDTVQYSIRCSVAF